MLCPRDNVEISRSASMKDARKKPEAYCCRSRISDAADFMLPQERHRQNNWDTVLAASYFQGTPSSAAILQNNDAILYIINGIVRQ